MLAQGQSSSPKKKKKERKKEKKNPDMKYFLHKKDILVLTVHSLFPDNNHCGRAHLFSKCVIFKLGKLHFCLRV